MPNRALVRTLHIAAGGVLTVGLVLAALQVLAAVGQLQAQPVATLSDILRQVGPVGLYLMLGVGLSALMAGAAAMLQRPAGDPATSDSATIFNAQGELSDAIASLRADVEAMAGRAAPVDTVSPVEAAPPAPADSSLDATLGRITAALDELREVVLMDEAQRQRRRAEQAEARKRAQLEQVAGLIDGAQWSGAAEAIEAMEAEYDSDADIAAIRQRLADARQRVQEAAFASVSTRAEDLMAMASWEEAMRLVEQFTVDFPGHAAGRQLLARVDRERTLFRETTVQRLYDEIRHDVERRNWRRALAASQRLLERFGDHARAGQIRGRLAVIQDNAEIEERQEQESRIQELIRSRRYGEAIELSHRLIEQFPDSPQAQELRELLPKLRELRAKEEG